MSQNPQFVTFSLPSSLKNEEHAQLQGRSLEALREHLNKIDLYQTLHHIKNCLDQNPLVESFSFDRNSSFDIRLEGHDVDGNELFWPLEHRGVNAEIPMEEQFATNHLHECIEQIPLNIESFLYDYPFSLDSLKGTKIYTDLSLRLQKEALKDLTAKTHTGLLEHSTYDGISFSLPREADFSEEIFDFFKESISQAKLHLFILDTQQLSLFLTKLFEYSGQTLQAIRTNRVSFGRLTPAFELETQGLSFSKEQQQQWKTSLGGCSPEVLYAIRKKWIKNPSDQTSPAIFNQLLSPELFSIWEQTMLRQASNPQDSADPLHHKKNIKSL